MSNGTTPDRVELDRGRTASRRVRDPLPQLIARVTGLQHAEQPGHQRQQDADDRQAYIDRDAATPLHQKACPMLM